MHLRTATKHDLAVMMDWFPDSHSCRIWGGPEFRFPFSAQSFQEDSRFEVLPSYVHASDQTLIGFGQYYLRAGRCHLSRLAVSPTRRGQGWGSRLLAALADLGSAALGAEQCSLFVAADNSRAAQLYRRLGFTEAPYPGAELPMRGILYLVADVRSIGAHAARAPGAAASPPG